MNKIKTLGKTHLTAHKEHDEGTVKTLTWIYDDLITFAGREVAIRSSSSDLIASVSEVNQIITQQAKGGAINGKFELNSEEFGVTECAWWFVDYKEVEDVDDSLEEDEKDEIINEMAEFITQMVGGSSDDRKKMTIYNTMVKIGSWR